MDRNKKLLIPASERVVKRLSEKYPNLTPKKARDIFAYTVRKLMRYSMYGLHLSIDQHYTIIVYVNIKSGNNYVVKSQRGVRACSMASIGTELEFAFKGHITRYANYTFNVMPFMKRELQQLADDEKYINAVT